MCATRKKNVLELGNLKSLNITFKTIFPNITKVKCIKPERITI